MVFIEELNDAGQRMVLDDVLAGMTGAEVFELARHGRLNEALGVMCELRLEMVDDETLLMVDDRDRAALGEAVAAL